jgi:hypothetical protein
VYFETITQFSVAIEWLELSVKLPDERSVILTEVHRGFTHCQEPTLSFFYIHLLKTDSHLLGAILEVNT